MRTFKQIHAKLVKAMKASDKALTTLAVLSKEGFKYERFVDKLNVRHAKLHNNASQEVLSEAHSLKLDIFDDALLKLDEVYDHIGEQLKPILALDKKLAAAKIADKKAKRAERDAKKKAAEDEKEKQREAAAAKAAEARKIKRMSKKPEDMTADELRKHLDSGATAEPAAEPTEEEAAAALAQPAEPEPAEPEVKVTNAAVEVIRGDLAARARQGQANVAAAVAADPGLLVNVLAEAEPAQPAPAHAPVHKPTFEEKSMEELTNGQP